MKTRYKSSWLFVIIHAIKRDMDFDRVQRLYVYDYLSKLRYEILLKRLKRGEKQNDIIR